MAAGDQRIRADVEYGRLMEAVANLEKQTAERHQENKDAQKILFDKIDGLQEQVTEMQASINRFHGAKGMAALMIAVLGTLAGLILEWMHVPGHHK